MGELDVYRIKSARGLRPLLQFHKAPLVALGEIARQGIDILKIVAGETHVYFVNHPALIQDVLVTHDWNFVKGRGLRTSKPVFGNGLLTSEGELHRRQRRMAQPAFHHARLAQYGRTMVELSAAMIRDWGENAQLAIDREMSALTLQIVGRTLFTADLLHEAKYVGDAIAGSLGYFGPLNSPFLQRVPALHRWVSKRSAGSRRRFEGVLSRIVADHRAEPHRYRDMLSMLMAVDDDAGTGYMSDELLLDEALTLFLAGHETTANALTWTWYLLAQHPEAEEKLHRELDTVLRGRLPTPDDVPALRYTGQLFREVLRLYPPGWIITREAVTGYRLGLLAIPPGATLMMSPYATQRDARFWKQPEDFAPERWQEAGIEAGIEAGVKDRPKFAYFPFGAGTRVCIGEHFAILEGVLLIAVIARQWRLRLLSELEVEPLPQMTLRPRQSIPMRLERRLMQASSAAAA